MAAVPNGPVGIFHGLLMANQVHIPPRELLLVPRDLFPSDNKHPAPLLFPCLTEADTPLQYAERLPIGKEDIIQGIPASKVLAFYKRWYRPENMAVIAVGDFEDIQAVVGMIEQRLGKCRAADTEAEKIPK